jgi:hypothetical protein
MEIKTWIRKNDCNIMGGWHIWRWELRTESEGSRDIKIILLRSCRLLHIKELIHFPLARGQVYMESQQHIWRSQNTKPSADLIQTFPPKSMGS